MTSPSMYRRAHSKDVPGSPVAPGGPRTLQLRLYWWANPLVPALIFGPIVAAFVIMSGPDAFAQWDVVRVFSGEHFKLVLAGTVALVAGAIAGGALVGRRREVSMEINPRQLQALVRAESVMLVLVLVAYAVWISSAIAGGADVALALDVLRADRGAVSAIKDVSAPITGVTTLTQVAPVLMAVSLIIRRVDKASSRTYVFIVVLLLSLARALFYGERLALIEVLIPMVLVLAVTVRPQRRVRRALLSFAPVLGIPALWGVFAAFEYTRSWAARNDGSYGTFGEYITSRLLGYYATSVNNSAIYHDALDGYSHLAAYPFQAIWDMPVVGDLARALVGPPLVAGIELRTWWGSHLDLVANPEYVNTGTFAVVAADLGLAGLLAYFACIGLFVGWAFQQTAHGRLGWLIVYAVSYIGLLELSRILYYSTGRFVVTLATAALVGRMLSRAATVTSNDRPLGRVSRRRRRHFDSGRRAISR